MSTKTITITPDEAQIICDALYEAARAAEFALNATHTLLSPRERNRGFDLRYRYVELRSLLFKRLNA